MYNPSNFPYCIPSFDPKVDRSAVDQTGFIDLRKAFENGVIEGNVALTDTHFNGMDPDDIMYRPKDSFEALRQVEYVRESLKAAEAQPEQVTQQGESK